MNARLQYALTVEHALAHDLPLQAELNRLSPLGPVPSAAAAAGEGHLPLALHILQVDPLMASCLQIEPHAARDVGDCLRSVPGTPWVIFTVATPAAYLCMVLGVEVLVSWLLQMKVGPALAVFGPPSLSMGRAILMGGTAAALLLLLWAVLLLVFQIRFEGQAILRLFDGMRAARLFAAASALDRHGVAPVRSIPLLLGPARLPAESLQRMGGAAGLDAVTCAELSRVLSEGVRRNTGLAAGALKIGGGMVLAVIAFSQVSAVYLAMAHLSEFGR